MSNEVINRIVGCAHYHKITTVDDLLKETDWLRERVSEYGEDILSLIRQHCPPASETEVGPGPSRKRAQVKCGACQEFGHNSTIIFFFLCMTDIFFSLGSNRKCPKRTERCNLQPPASDTENTPPSQAHPCTDHGDQPQNVPSTLHY